MRKTFIGFLVGIDIDDCLFLAFAVAIASIVNESQALLLILFGAVSAVLMKVSTKSHPKGSRTEFDKK